MDQLIEMPHVRQIEGELRRRWFSCRDADLIVWLYPNSDEPEGFQFCYSNGGREFAVTCHDNQAPQHSVVDSGERVGMRMKRTPILHPTDSYDRALLVDTLSHVEGALPDNIKAKIREALAIGAHEFRPVALPTQGALRTRARWQSVMSPSGLSAKTAIVVWFALLVLIGAATVFIFQAIGEFRSQSPRQIPAETKPLTTSAVSCPPTPALRQGVHAPVPTEFSRRYPPGTAKRSLESLQSVIEQRSKGALEAIYAHALRANPCLAGTFHVAVAVTPAGTVAGVIEVKSTLNDADFEHLLLAHVRRIEFQSVRGTGYSIFSYPLSFSPRPNEAGAVTNAPD